MKASEVEKKRLDRLHILYSLYNFSTTKGTDLKELAFKHDIKNGSFESAFNYLVAENLIERVGSTPNIHKISHSGIKLIESAIISPDKVVSELFPALKDLDIAE